MAIRITDDAMTLEIDNPVVATARFRGHAAADGNGAWIVSTHPARLFTRDQAITALITVTGALSPVPSSVTVQPIMPDDAANGVAQRVFFPVGATIVPRVTVSLSDPSLYGYITKGQSTRCLRG
jgi:hypothetical protein